MKIYRLNNCISIVGPTATGKTERALEVAHQLITEKKVFGVDIISADSRQVYKGLEVLTGADVPEGFEAVTLRLPFDKLRVTSQHDSLTSQSDLPHFTNIDSSIRIFGISMIDPSDEWSLAHFINFAREVMLRSLSNNRQLILVGGTGLYHKHLFSDDKTPQIPQDQKFRKQSQKMSVEELQQKLNKIKVNRLEQLSESDRENPRRLIRAIEVAIWQQKHRGTSLLQSGSTESPIVWSQVNNQVEFLSAPLETIKERIEQRVQKRLTSGAVQEVQNLLKLNLLENSPVVTTLGAPEIKQYLEGSLSEQECQQLWVLHEFQYAKRQLTWWRNS
jgi:tRNA dimethylallyltransferase